jgi:hypothetical protein
MNACRYCGLPLKHSVCDLGMLPLANSYLAEAQVGEPEMFYPLHARICSDCLLLQVGELQPPASEINERACLSSHAQRLREDVTDFAQRLTDCFSLDRSTQVLEIGSGDGSLVRNFITAGIPAVGVEPDEKVAAIARRQGIPTEIGSFGAELARTLVRRGQGADLLIGDNVLAHTGNLKDVVAGLSIVLAPDGVITMDFPHVLQLIVRNQFDTIRHDCFSYFSLLTLGRVFDANGLRVFDVDRVGGNGGSLRIYACHKRFAARQTTGRVREIENAERDAHLDSLEGYLGYPEEVSRIKRNLLRYLIEARDLGYATVAYGAAANGNTLLNYCGIRDDLVSYAVDRSPHKQGKFLPGTHLPIYPPSRIRETRPDYVLVLPWHLRDEITAELSYIREWGGRFIVPIPELSIVR